jgi:hypothetical protein
MHHMALVFSSETTSVERVHDQNAIFLGGYAPTHRRVSNVSAYPARRTPSCSLSDAKKLSRGGAHFVRLLLDAAELGARA